MVVYRLPVVSLRTVLFWLTEYKACMYIPVSSHRHTLLPLYVLYNHMCRCSLYQEWQLTPFRSILHILKPDIHLQHLSTILFRINYLCCMTVGKNSWIMSREKKNPLLLFKEKISEWFNFVLLFISTLVCSFSGLKTFFSSIISICYVASIYLTER